MTEKQLVEVQRFLYHKEARVRLGAVEIVSGCSTDTQLHPFFTKLNIGKQLLHLIGDVNKEIARHSCVSLVNLSSNPNFSLNLLKCSPFDCIVKHLRSDSITEKMKELLIKTMLNVTQTQEGISQLLQIGTSVQGLHVIRIVHMLKNVDVYKSEQIRIFHYLPFLLCNVTQNEIGRQLITEPQRNLIRHLVLFMDYNFDYDTLSESDCYKIFHRGVWSLMRNCLWCLRDEPKQYLDGLKKKQKINENTSEQQIKKLISGYYLRIFFDFGQQMEWAQNQIFFEIINPLIGPLHEYKATLRRKLMKRRENENGIDALLKRMDFDKERFDDEEIRKIALECLHLMAGVDDDFDLHLLFPKIMKNLFVCELLKEYEEWEYLPNLVKISQDIRATIKEKTKKVKENNETKDDEIKERETTEENDDKEMKVEPIAQQYHSVQTTAKKSFDNQQSNALFDLVMQHTKK